jgi:foldase protein PrsA
MESDMNKEHKEEVVAQETHEDELTKKVPMISTKNAIILSSIIIVLALLFSYKSVFIAAVVNGSPISRLSVINEIEKKSGKAALDSIIIQKILADEVQKRGITVSEADIDAEMKIIEARFTAQGATLDAMLTAQGLTRDDVKKQIVTQVQVEKLLGDKIAVSDSEVSKYVTDNKITVPKDKDAEMRTQVAAQLKQDKTNKEGNALVESLRSEAKVTYFVQY